MKIAIFDWHRSSYHYKKSNSESLERLGSFLARDVRSGKYSRADDVKFWIKDPMETEFDTERRWLEKEDGLIVIGGQYDTFEDGPPDYHRIKPDKFIKVIDRWLELCAEQPKEIVFTQDEDCKIMLRGNNEVVPEAALYFHKKLGRYRYKRANDNHLYTLARFFEHDFVETPYVDVPGFKKWLDNSEEKSFFHQYLSIKKKKDFIAMAYDPGEHNQIVLELEKKKLINLIDSFEYISKVKPMSIVITKKNEEIFLKADNEEI